MLEPKCENAGLYLEEIDAKTKLLIDPDNVFWGILKKEAGTNLLIPEGLLSLYDKTKKKCAQEMKHIRFDTELTAIYIDPTDLCNADCTYCYVPAKIRKQGRSMTGQELNFILNKIANYFSAKGGSPPKSDQPTAGAYGGKGKQKKPVIVFHASEPLLVKEMIFKAIEKFSDRFHFGVQTNALLLEKEDAAFFKENKVSIGISLDAADMHTNNRLRYSQLQGGNFKKAVGAIEWFKGYKGLNVITTMTKLNIHKLAALVKFLHKKGVGCVLINPVRLTQKNSRRLRPDDKIMAGYFIEAVKEAIRCSMNSKQQIIIGNFANIILGIIAPSARRLMCDISPCGGGRCFFTITASGDMIPCGEFIGLRKFSGGNIFRDSIASAMQSREFKQIRARFVEKIPECDACLLRNICGAPCPSELYSLGDMYKKSVFCEFYKEIIAYAYKLIAEGKEKYCFRDNGLDNLVYEYNLGG